MVDDGEKNKKNNEGEKIIFFSPDERIFLEQCLIGTSRKYANAKFTNFLSTKLNKNGVNCRLKCMYNWIKKEYSCKRNSPFFNGTYMCSLCKGIFKVKMQSENDDFFSIKYSHEADHEIIKKVQRFNSQDRLNFGSFLKSKGVSNIRAENIIKNIHQEPMGNKNFENIF
jgi:hypothetical protein